MGLEIMTPASVGTQLFGKSFSESSTRIAQGAGKEKEKKESSMHIAQKLFFNKNLPPIFKTRIDQTVDSRHVMSSGLTNTWAWVLAFLNHFFFHNL